MPISQAGRASSRAATAGFTLVELLVVVTIVAVLALGVGLTGGGVFSRASGTPQSVGAQIQQSVRLARDRALLGRMPVGLRPARDGWQLVVADGEGRWNPLGGRHGASGADLRWQVGTERFLPGLAAPRPGDRPAIVFRPDGGGQAFSLTAIEGPQRLVCRFDGWGALTCP